MKLYRFSPIADKGQLLAAIAHIHFACFELCKQALGYMRPRDTTEKVRTKIATPTT